jgi:DnaJ-class molecular chaperone
MIQQMQSPCADCGATGEKVDPAKVCNACKGKKTTKDKKILEVTIDKGISSKHRCVQRLSGTETLPKKSKCTSYPMPRIDKLVGSFFKDGICV